MRRFAVARSIVHGVDLGSEARVDGGPAKFAHGGEQPVVWRERFAKHGEITDLAIMWQIGIHSVNRRLHGGRFHGARNESAKITAAVADHHDLLRAGK